MLFNSAGHRRAMLSKCHGRRLESRLKVPREPRNRPAIGKTEHYDIDATMRVALVDALKREFFNYSLGRQALDRDPTVGKPQDAPLDNSTQNIQIARSIKNK